MARLVLEYAGGETRSLDVNHTSAVGLRLAVTNGSPVDHWFAAEGLNSVVLVHDKGETEITAPPFVDGVSANRGTF